MNQGHKNVLVAPLDWGLGHATRCIPVIKELIRQNCNVIISAGGGGKIILQKEFPNCTFVEIPGIAIRYPENGSMVFSMLEQMPRILKAISKEHELLDKIIDKYQITHVISDNRYGLYSSKVKTAFITHQINISGGSSLKFLEPLIHFFNIKFIQKFNALWIPDIVPPGNLSGNLSEVKNVNIEVSHLGILSRFTEKATSTTKLYDYIALLSGPEPQRSLLENKLKTFFSKSGKKWLLIQGLPGNNKPEINSIVNSISDADLKNILHPDTILICRPGYSTIMDLVVLGHQRILFIPTPGQTEQEYLAEYIFRSWGTSYINQQEEIPEAEKISPGTLPNQIGNDTLNMEIKIFLNDNPEQRK